MARAAVVPGGGRRGADCLQLREKGLGGAALLERARRLVGICREGFVGVSVVINDDVEVALGCGADGVHLGRGDMPVAEARGAVGDRLLIGASTCDLGQAREAIEAGADYCGVGPMYVTATKPGRRAATVGYLRAFREAFGGVAHLAIGGIGLENIGAVLEAGARGVAVSSVVCGAEDPGAVVAELAGRVWGDGE